MASYREEENAEKQDMANTAIHEGKQAENLEKQLGPLRGTIQKRKVSEEGDKNETTDGRER